jgi:hypothetical protein
MLCLPASAECCGKNSSDRVALADQPLSQIQNPQNEIEGPFAQQISIREYNTNPLATVAGSPSDWAQTAKIFAQV